MAYLAPIAVVVVGATIGIVMLWVKIDPRVAAPAPRAPRCLIATLRSRRPAGTYRGCMVGSWTVEPMSFAEVGAPWRRARRLARRSRRVLVRRGLGDPDGGPRLSRGRGHRARPVPARRHGGGRRADPRRRRSGRADLRARRLRRRRDLRHGARRPDAAGARRRRRSGTCRAASRRATASRAPTVERLAAEGVEPPPHGRLRHHRRRRGRTRPGGSAWT